MAEFTAKDVQALRQSTGAGMMDAKKALQETDGDFEAAKKLLREKGLAKAASRGDRDNAEGAVAVASSDTRAVLVELKCETDFVAKSTAFTQLTQDLAEAFAADGQDGIDKLAGQVDDLRVSLKENIQVGRAVKVDVGSGEVVDTYLHRQEGRGVNGVILALSGGSQQLAHDIAVHIAFAKPEHLTREDVPAELVEEERETLRKISLAEGKPEKALDKIVEGRMNGWYKDRVLVDQPFVRDEKQTIAQLAASQDAQVVGFAQVYIGG